MKQSITLPKYLSQQQLELFFNAYLPRNEKQVS